jgi:hypothetical protein
MSDRNERLLIQTEADVASLRNEAMQRRFFGLNNAFRSARTEGEWDRLRQGWRRQGEIGT